MMDAVRPVIVIGDEPRTPGDQLTERRRPALVLIGMAMAFAAALTWITTWESDVAPFVNSNELSAPEEPETVRPPGTAPAAVNPSAPALATGWQSVDLLGSASAMVSVDHGPAGWLAVSEGPHIVAHVSEESVIWTPRTLRGLVGSDPRAHVGSDLMVVTASNPNGIDGAGGVATSDDGGRTWSVVGLPGVSSIEDVTSGDDTVWLAGSGSEYSGAASTTEPSVATAWILDTHGWTTVVLEGSPGSSGSTVLTTEKGGAFVFGHDTQGPAAWTIDRAGTVTRLPLRTPQVETPSRFVDVVRTETGFWALVGRTGEDGGNTLWSSAEGSTWLEIDGVDLPYLTGLKRHDDRLLGTALAQAAIWSSQSGIVHNRYLNTRTGWESVYLASDLAVAGDRMVIAGSGADGAALMVRGTVVGPVELRPMLPDGESRWVEMATFPTSGTGSHSAPLGAVTVGDTSIVLAGTSLLRLEGDSMSKELDVHLPLRGSGLDAGGVWFAEGSGSGSVVRRFAGTSWQSQDIPLEYVLAYWSEGGLAAGFSGGELEAVQLEAKGIWAERRPPGIEATLVGVPGGVLSMTRSSDGPSLSFSTDGVDWNRVSGDSELVKPGGFGGVPYLIDADDPHSITLVDRWPQRTTLTAPPGTVVAVHRYEESVMIQTDRALHVIGEDRTIELPLDLEHGLDGPIVAIPGPTPRVATLSDGIIRVFAWQ